MASQSAMNRLFIASAKQISRQTAVAASTTTTATITTTTATAIRSFSAGSYSKYEYPNAKQPPEITKTTAKEAAAHVKVLSEKAPPGIAIASADSNTVDPQKLQNRLMYSMELTDRFDDLGSMSPTDRQAAKSRLQPPTLTGATAIEPTVPTHIPPNVPATELEVPTTKITTLPNGMRVVSQETYGQVSTVGVVADVGSRHEPQLGVAHLWELVAFGATSQYGSALEIQNLLQDWGGSRFVNTGREQSLVCIDILRPNVEKAMHLLQQALLEPQFLPDEVEDAKRTMEFQALDLPPELVMEEALQKAAYGTDQQLGKPHFCPMDALPNLDDNVLREFWYTKVLPNPHEIVVAGAGIGHDQLVDLTNQYFGDWPTAADGETHAKTIPSTYRGGEHFVKKPSFDGLTRVALAFELDGWHSKDLVPTCVMQTLLGGGNSFSAGGPGKGMYSRLYRQVLNRYSWAESAEAFTSIHSESGLWGITGSSKPAHSKDVLHVLADHVARLSLDLVTDEELDRARNMLKCNVLTQLESRLVLFEDMGRQVLTYGMREDMDTTCEKIDSVTKEELRELARKALRKAPTVAAVGENLSKQGIPSQKEVQGWFQGAI